MNLTDPSGLYPGEGFVKGLVRVVGCAAVITAGVGAIVLLGFTIAPVLEAIVLTATIIATAYDLGAVFSRCGEEWWSDGCQQSLTNFITDTVLALLQARTLRVLLALVGVIRVGEATSGRRSSAVRTA